MTISDNLFESQEATDLKVKKLEVFIALQLYIDFPEAKVKEFCDCLDPPMLALSIQQIA